MDKRTCCCQVEPAIRSPGGSPLSHLIHCGLLGQCHHSAYVGPACDTGTASAAAACDTQPTVQRRAWGPWCCPPAANTMGHALVRPRARQCTAAGSSSRSCSQTCCLLHTIILTLSSSKRSEMKTGLFAGLRLLKGLL